MTVVVLVAVVLGGYGLARTTPLTGLSGQVASNGQVALGFPYAGLLSSVLVRAGEHVDRGQVLATEQVPGSLEQVAADRAALAAAEQQVTALTSLLTRVGTALHSEEAAQGRAANAEVQAAVDAIGAARTTQSAAISSLQVQVRSAQALLQTDQASYRAECSGVSLPASGSATTTQQECVVLDHDVAGDELAVSAAEASLASQETVQAEWLALANRDRSDAAAAAAGPIGPPVITTSGLEADLLRAEAQLPLDRAQLATDRARAGATKLLAPAAGTVVAVTGLAGELVSPSGVDTPAASGGSVAVTPGFQLFPSHQTQVGSGVPSSPVVVLDTQGATHGALLVNVVVPESQIGLVRVGAAATVHPSIAGLPAARAVVDEVFPGSVVAAGVVSYEVQLRVGSTAGVSRFLPGMTVTASIAR